MRFNPWKALSVLVEALLYLYLAVFLLFLIWLPVYVVYLVINNAL